MQRIPVRTLGGGNNGHAINHAINIEAERCDLHSTGGDRRRQKRGQYKNKLSRGKFTAAFMLQCMEALQILGLRL